jgi:phenylalanyl-tRNA synthetase beta chain
MKERLRRAGVRSLHPVVDVTNYVMLELGQPMHAFDFEKLKGGIDVRRAKPGERLSMLDGREAALQPDMLLIADQSGPVALAGIMGGAPSAVSERTQHLFLESAWFSPNAVAGRARALGLHTESSQRFERGVDPELARTAMERATDLIVRIVGGKPGPVVEVKKNAALPKHKPIVLRAARIAKILGHAIPASVIMVILKRLNFRVAKKAKHFEVTAPSWRFDIEHEVDLIEEIARVHGYEKLTARRPTQAMRALPISESKNSLARFRTVLIDRDYQEIITYSFVDPHLQALLDTHAHAIRLANPISADMAEMRLSLLPGLLKTIQYNQNRQLDRLRFFETGRVFVGEGKVTQQPIRLGAAVTGNVWPTQWGAPVRTVDFFDAKADLEALLTLTGLENEFRFEPYPHPALHPGQCARLLYKAEPVGWVGMLHPAVQNKLDLKRPVAVFEVEIGALTSARTPRFSEISKFPAIRRDLAFELAREIPAQKVLDTAKKAAGNLLVNLELFDEYRGEGIDPLRKSLALGLTFQDFSRTLKENEIEALTARIVAVLVSELGAKLRGAAV